MGGAVEAAASKRGTQDKVRNCYLTLKTVLAQGSNQFRMNEFNNMLISCAMYLESKDEISGNKFGLKKLLGNLWGAREVNLFDVP